MSRADEQDVRGIVENDPDISMSIFIETAAELTAYIESCAATVPSDNRLKVIETWLAAHFYSIRDQQFQSVNTDGASATYQGQTAMYLDSTHWGQQAITLDTTGCLAGLVQDAKQGKRQLKMEWLGKPPSEQVDYVDRD